MILRRFAIRKGSGGDGKYRGGDGCVRCLQFRRNLQLSILSERRTFEPYGLDGGKPGKRGLNILQKFNGRRVNIGGKTCLDVDAGVSVSENVLFSVLFK